MKSENKPANLGRAHLVHSLRAKGVKKEKALAEVKAKFNCPMSLLERIWKRSERGAKVVAKAAKGAKAKASKGAKKVAAAVESATPAPQEVPAS